MKPSVLPAPRTAWTSRRRAASSAWPTTAPAATGRSWRRCGWGWTRVRLRRGGLSLRAARGCRRGGEKPARPPRLNRGLGSTPSGPRRVATVQGGVPPLPAPGPPAPPGASAAGPSWPRPSPLFGPPVVQGPRRAPLSAPGPRLLSACSTCLGALSARIEQQTRREPANWTERGRPPKNAGAGGGQAQGTRPLRTGRPPFRPSPGPFRRPHHGVATPSTGGDVQGTGSAAAGQPTAGLPRS